MQWRKRKNIELVLLKIALDDPGSAHRERLLLELLSLDLYRMVCAF